MALHADHRNLIRVAVVKLNQLPAIREIKLANLPVNLIQPPAFTIQLLTHLPRLAACTIHLPVHAIKLPTDLTVFAGFSDSLSD